MKGSGPWHATVAGLLAAAAVGGLSVAIGFGIGSSSEKALPVGLGLTIGIGAGIGAIAAFVTGGTAVTFPED